MLFIWYKSAITKTNEENNDCSSYLCINHVFCRLCDLQRNVQQVVGSSKKSPHFLQNEGCGVGRALGTAR